MVTVTSRPQGHKIIDQAITAQITDSSGDALVTFASHGLSDGDFVYIESDIDEYNGFWEVDAINANTFKLVLDGGFVEYYQDQEITYYQTQSHDWSSIFLPIMYKATNNRWPLNSIDTVRTVSSTADDNGFLRLNLSGAIKSDVRDLEFVKITFSDASYVVAQIVEVISTSSLVVNLPYDSYSITAVQYYYNNYQVRVKVYAGLPPSHPWQDKKLMEEVAELSLTPDENNNVIFSISDYIKLKVAIKNNLTLFSLPLNLDAFTGFYIATGESYDASDNYTLYTVESDFTDDTFQGYAITGKLPFKNMYAGDYAEYVYTSGSPARWLTNRERLLAVEGYYFDISFIKSIVGDFWVIIDKYNHDYLQNTDVIPYTDQGIGVYRIPITPDATYTRFCVRVYVPGQPGTPGEQVNVEDFPDMSTWLNMGTGGDWTISSTPSYNPFGLGTSKEFRSTPGYTGFVLGREYTVEVDYDKSHFFGDENMRTLSVDINDAVGAPLFGEDTILALGDTSGTITVTFTDTGLPLPVRGIEFQYNSNSDDNVTLTITALRIYYETEGTPGTDPATLTETICIDILETCEIENGFTPSDDRRLLEDGDYRLLE